MNTKAIVAHSLALVLVILTTGCATGGPMNVGGSTVVDLDPARRGLVAGVGIEGQDIISMTDQMMRDMLSSRDLAARQVPPQIIVDGQYFQNDSSQRINKNLITDRLRVALNRSAHGRMTFVGREYAQAVAEERDLKRNGVVDVGATGLTRAQAGADFRLVGRIGSADSVSSRSGYVQRYTQISFEMLDLERGTVVWSGIYEFERAGADDVVYR